MKWTRRYEHNKNVHKVQVEIKCLSFQKAEAQLAYELQAAKIQQGIKQEELQIQVFNSFKFPSLVFKFTLSCFSSKNLNSYKKDQDEIHHEFMFLI